MRVSSTMFRCLLIGLLCTFSGVALSQVYVTEGPILQGIQAKHAVGWDLSRLARGQAVATAEHWFHPEFSAYVSGGRMVARPLAPLPGTELDWNTVQSGSVVGAGVRFHPMAPESAKTRAFVGFELNRDRYVFLENQGPNAWVHRELRALIGATRNLGNHVVLTGHVAVNATHDRFQRQVFNPGGASMSIPGRIAGLQLAYRW